MTRPRYSRFFWSDWRGDPKLRVVSLAARGLWMEMLAIMAEAEPFGHLVINGLPVSDKQLAALVSAEARDVARLRGELADAGVFSIDERGRIYSRRMVRDAEQAELDRANGKRGGNPKLKKRADDSSGGPAVDPLDAIAINVEKRRKNADRQKRYREKKRAETVTPGVTLGVTRNVTQSVTRNVTRNVTKRNAERYDSPKNPSKTATVTTLTPGLKPIPIPIPIDSSSETVEQRPSLPPAAQEGGGRSRPSEEDRQRRAEEQRRALAAFAAAEQGAIRR